MAKQTLSTTGDETRDITTYELPKRVEQPIPENAIPAEDLCNAGDIVVRGVGKRIKTEMGAVRPIFFQHADDYARKGPVPMGVIYDEDGLLCATVAEEYRSNENGGTVRVWQFITSETSPVMRVAQKINEAVAASDADAGANGRVGELRSKQSVANPGQRYYFLA